MLTPVKLTPKQEVDWEKTRTTLTVCCPGFTHIFHTMLNTVSQKTLALFTEDIEFIAATDGSALIAKPSRFFALALMEQVFVVNHEILHCIWNHCALGRHLRNQGYVLYQDGTKLPYIHEYMNVAMDLVINDLLIESGKEKGQTCGTAPKGVCWDPSIATKDDSVIDAYRKLYKKKPPKKINIGGGQPCKDGDPGNSQGNAPPIPGGFDGHLEPGTTQGKDAAQAEAERSEAQWGAAVAAAVNVARLQGKLPAALDRFFSEILNPQVDWRDQIKGLFARRVGSGGYDWRKADRRLIVRDIYAPARSGNGCGTIVVGVDTSGSVGDEELAMFAGEIAGLLEDCRPRRLIALECDAKVHQAREYDEPSDLAQWKKHPPKGGGGTSFIPVFEWIAAEGIEPDALVYLTDGMGDFPAHAPSYPVIWGSIFPQAKYPWGDVVDVPKQAGAER